MYELAKLITPQKQLLAGFEREMKVLAYSGIWCGDCVQQGPLVQRIAEGNVVKNRSARPGAPGVDGELIEDLRVNGSSHVSVVLFFSEDWYWCATAGDRTLNRYRALALSKLGPSCPTGVLEPEQAELDATLADWPNEFERVQLMLRLTPRLRKYQD